MVDLIDSYNTWETALGIQKDSQDKIALNIQLTNIKRDLKTMNTTSPQLESQTKQLMEEFPLDSLLVKTHDWKDFDRSNISTFLLVDKICKGLHEQRSFLLETTERHTFKKLDAILRTEIPAKDLASTHIHEEAVVGANPIQYMKQEITLDDYIQLLLLYNIGNDEAYYQKQLLLNKNQFNAYLSLLNNPDNQLTGLEKEAIIKDLVELNIHKKERDFDSFSLKAKPLLRDNTIFNLENQTIVDSIGHANGFFRKLEKQFLQPDSSTKIIEGLKNPSKFPYNNNADYELWKKAVSKNIFQLKKQDIPLDYEKKEMEEFKDSNTFGLLHFIKQSIINHSIDLHKAHFCLVQFNQLQKKYKAAESNYASVIDTGEKSLWQQEAIKILDEAKEFALSDIVKSLDISIPEGEIHDTWFNDIKDNIKYKFPKIEEENGIQKNLEDFFEEDKEFSIPDNYPDPLKKPLSITNLINCLNSNVKEKDSLIDNIPDIFAEVLGDFPGNYISTQSPIVIKKISDFSNKREHLIEVNDLNSKKITKFYEAYHKDLIDNGVGHVNTFQNLVIALNLFYSLSDQMDTLQKTIPLEEKFKNFEKEIENIEKKANDILQETERNSAKDDGSFSLVLDIDFKSKFNEIKKESKDLCNVVERELHDLKTLFTAATIKNINISNLKIDCSKFTDEFIYLDNQLTNNIALVPGTNRPAGFSSAERDTKHRFSMLKYYRKQLLSNLNEMRETIQQNKDTLCNDLIPIATNDLSNYFFQSIYEKIKLYNKDPELVYEIPNAHWFSKNMEDFIKGKKTLNPVELSDLIQSCTWNNSLTKDTIEKTKNFNHTITTHINDLKNFVIASQKDIDQLSFKDFEEINKFLNSDDNPLFPNLTGTDNEFYLIPLNKNNHSFSEALHHIKTANSPISQKLLAKYIKHKKNLILFFPFNKPIQNNLKDIFNQPLVITDLYKLSAIPTGAPQEKIFIYLNLWKRESKDSSDKLYWSLLKIIEMQLDYHDENSAYERPYDVDHRTVVAYTLMLILYKNNFADGISNNKTKEEFQNSFKILFGDLASMTANDDMNSPARKSEREKYQKQKEKEKQYSQVLKKTLVINGILWDGYDFYHDLNDKLEPWTTANTFDKIFLDLQLNKFTSVTLANTIHHKKMNDIFTYKELLYRLNNHSSASSSTGKLLNILSEISSVISDGKQQINFDILNTLMKLNNDPKENNSRGVGELLRKAANYLIPHFRSYFDRYLANPITSLLQSSHNKPEYMLSVLPNSLASLITNGSNMMGNVQKMFKNFAKNPLEMKDMNSLFQEDFTSVNLDTSHREIIFLLISIEELEKSLQEMASFNMIDNQLFDECQNITKNLREQIVSIFTAEEVQKSTAFINQYEDLKEKLFIDDSLNKGFIVANLDRDLAPNNYKTLYNKAGLFVKRNIPMDLENSVAIQDEVHQQILQNLMKNNSQIHDKFFKNRWQLSMFDEIASDPFITMNEVAYFNLLPNNSASPAQIEHYNFIREKIIKKTSHDMEKSSALREIFFEDSIEPYMMFRLSLFRLSNDKINTLIINMGTGTVPESLSPILAPPAAVAVGSDPLDELNKLLKYLQLMPHDQYGNLINELRKQPELFNSDVDIWEPIKEKSEKFLEDSLTAKTNFYTGQNTVGINKSLKALQKVMQIIAVLGDQVAKNTGDSYIRQGAAALWRLVGVIDNSLIPIDQELNMLKSSSYLNKTIERNWQDISKDPELKKKYLTALEFLSKNSRTLSILNKPIMDKIRSQGNVSDVAMNQEMAKNMMAGKVQAKEITLSPKELLGSANFYPLDYKDTLPKKTVEVIYEYSNVETIKNMFPEEKKEKLKELPKLLLESIKEKMKDYMEFFEKIEKDNKDNDSNSIFNNIFTPSSKEEDIEKILSIIVQRGNENAGLLSIATQFTAASFLLSRYNDSVDSLIKIMTNFLREFFGNIMEDHKIAGMSGVQLQSHLNTLKNQMDIGLQSATIKENLRNILNAAIKDILTSMFPLMHPASFNSLIKIVLIGRSIHDEANNPHSKLNILGSYHYSKKELKESLEKTMDIMWDHYFFADKEILEIIDKSYESD